MSRVELSSDVEYDQLFIAEEKKSCNVFIAPVAGRVEEAVEDVNEHGLFPIRARVHTTTDCLSKAIEHLFGLGNKINLIKGSKNSKAKN